MPLKDWTDPRYAVAVAAYRKLRADTPPQKRRKGWPTRPYGTGLTLVIDSATGDVYTVKAP